MNKVLQIDRVWLIDMALDEKETFINTKRYLNTSHTYKHTLSHFEHLVMKTTKLRLFLWYLISRQFQLWLRKWKTCLRIFNLQFFFWPFHFDSFFSYVHFYLYNLALNLCPVKLATFRWQCVEY